MKKPQALIGLLAALGTTVGVLVAVLGLPYGRADYSAFAEVYHGTVNAGGTIHVAVDTDTSDIATDADTVYPMPGTVSVAADVTVGNETGADVVIAAFNFNLDSGDPGATKIDAVTPGSCLPPGTACNPNFSESPDGLAGAAWSCTPPNPDDDLDDSNATGDLSFISCSNASDPGTLMNGSHLDLARVNYTAVGGLGIAPLTLSVVNVFDNLGSEVLACNPGPGPCFNGSFEFAPPPTNTPAPPTSTPTDTSTPVPATATNTPTDTPTSTNTPSDPQIVKVPESCLPTPDPDNCIAGVPSAANLWICESGPCAGPGEGELKVYEVANAVQAGLGAYEFSVEYDNFVISSLNPCDIVFGPGGAGSARGPVDEVNTSSPTNSDCAPDPGPGGGTCAMSVILENVIHFGCATAGQAAGPTGSFTIASLVLVPHEDLSNDLFPGNDNGVVTIIKDNGCELVDTLGHPVPGSINGGLTVVCGDAVITVRILEGDLDLDCVVEVTDAQTIAGHYGAFFGSLLYSKWLDLEPNLHDLDIDIKDIQKVFGRIGSTCQDPIPAQTPVADFSPN